MKVEEPVKVEVEQLQALLLGVSNYLPVVLANTYFQHGECNFLFKSLLDLIVFIEVYFEVPGYANRIVKESADLLLSLADNVEEPSVTIEELEGGNRNRRLSATTAMTKYNRPPEQPIIHGIPMPPTVMVDGIPHVYVNGSLFTYEQLKANGTAYTKKAELEVEATKTNINNLKKTHRGKFGFSFLFSLVVVLTFRYALNIGAEVVLVGLPSVMLGSGVVAVEMASEKVAEAAFKIGSASYDATIGKAANAVGSFTTTVSDVAATVASSPQKFINFASSVSNYLFSKTVTAPAAAAATTATTVDTAATAVLTNTTDFTELINNATQIIQNRTFRDRLEFRKADINHVIHEMFKELITNHISTEDKYIATVLLVLLLTFIIFGIAWSIEKWAIAKSGVANVLINPPPKVDVTATEPPPQVGVTATEQFLAIHNTVNNNTVNNTVNTDKRRRASNVSKRPLIENGGSIKRRVTYRKKRFNRKTVKR